MFIVSLPKTPKDLVKQVDDTGLSWLAIESVSQRNGRHVTINATKDIKDYVDELRSAIGKDFGVWIWGGHPQPNNVRTRRGILLADPITKFVSDMIDTAVDVGAQGIIANPEDDKVRTWKLRKFRSAAKMLMDGLLSRARENCLSVGVTSHGRTDFHKKMPWDELARADFGLPLINRSKNMDVPRLCVEGWQAKGFKVVIPVLQIKDTSRGIRYSTKDMQDEVKRTPMPNCAIIWWSWKNASTRGWEAVKKAIMPIHCSSRRPSDYSCVMPQLRGSGFLGEAQSCMSLQPIPLSDTPQPCRFYTIKRGIDSKGLIDLAGRAYGVQTDKTKLAQWINNHPYNRRFWRTDLANKTFPQGRISFSPRFSRDISKQAQAAGHAPSGGAFATIFIPPPPGWLQKQFPSC